jgi:hypothetical protein
MAENDSDVYQMDEQVESLRDSIIIVHEHKDLRAGLELGGL